MVQGAEGEIEKRGYGRPEAPVGTERVAGHLSERVRDYDGGWTEWSDAVRAPVER